MAPRYAVAVALALALALAHAQTLERYDGYCTERDVDSHDKCMLQRNRCAWCPQPALCLPYDPCHRRGLACPGGNATFNEYDTCRGARTMHVGAWFVIAIAACCVSCLVLGVVCAVGYAATVHCKLWCARRRSSALEMQLGDLDASSDPMVLTTAGRTANGGRIKKNRSAK